MSDKRVYYRQDGAVVWDKTPIPVDPDPAPSPGPTYPLGEIDASILRRALWEAAAVLMLCLIWLVWAGFSWDKARIGLTIILLTLAITFMLKEPALEVGLKWAWRSAGRLILSGRRRRRLPPMSGAPVPDTAAPEPDPFPGQCAAALWSVFEAGDPPSREGVIACFNGNRGAWQTWQDRCIMKGLLVGGARGGGLKPSAGLDYEAAMDLWTQPIEPPRYQVNPYSNDLERI